MFTVQALESLRFKGLWRGHTPLHRCGMISTSPKVPIRYTAWQRARKQAASDAMAFQGFGGTQGLKPN